jgi:hypothetical protein
MKRFIILGILVFSTIGSWIGADLDHGNWFGATSNILGIVGMGVGIWVGYKIGQYVEEG